MYCRIVTGLLLASSAVFVPAAVAEGIDDQTFQARDVFGIEYASDPQISPDGSQVVYVRNFMDIMTDRQRSNLWIVNIDGSHHRALTTGNRNDASPRWSPQETA